MTASTWRTIGSTAGALAGLVLLAVFLAPPGSFPVGYDGFWNLLVAERWAESGFPAAMPEAGWTVLAENYGDRQLAFHGLIALWTGGHPSEGAVPPLLWALVALQGLGIFAAIRVLRPGASPLWLWVVPALSQVWLFRTATLRDMLLGTAFLIPLCAVAAARVDGSRARAPHGAWLAALAAAYTWSHGAVVLPIVLWLCIAAVTMAIRRTIPWRCGAWLLGGIALACVARPDFPANLTVLTQLNLGMPFARLRGELDLGPSEFLPLGFDDLWSSEFAFLLGALVLVFWTWRSKTRCWSILAPVAFVFVSALLSRRMFEVGAPLLAVALAVHAPPFRWQWFLAAFGLAAIVHLPRAVAGAEANRVTPLTEVGRWLSEEAEAGDTVFVTDWGTSSPLAWYTRDARLRFTGVIDPVLMWAHDRDAWQAWRAIKFAEDPDPLRTIRETFGARFLVFSYDDAPPEAETNITTQALLRALQGVDAPFFVAPDRSNPFQSGNWFAVKLQ